MADDKIRIGNAERDAAMKALDEHLSAGRLDLDEYGERYAKATVARTQDELAALFTDLPPVHVTPEQSSAGRSARSRSWMPIGARLAGVVPLLALVLFFTTGAWLWFLLIPLAAKLMGGRGYGHGYGRGWCGPGWR
jgi:hypothetical protein